VQGVIDTAMFELFFKFLIGHAVADFALQTDAIAKGKNRNRKGEAPPGQKYVPCWPFFLSAHALVHGGAVAIASGSMLLGLFETIAHWAIDFGKCENWYGVYVDQALHLLCKIGWVLIWMLS